VRAHGALRRIRSSCPPCPLRADGAGVRPAAGRG